MIKSSKPHYDDEEFDFENRIVSSEYINEDGGETSDSENALRPKTLSEYVGQAGVKEKLKISILFKR